jgi:YidC/Oxa1 family membrane protein insertase
LVTLLQPLILLEEAILEGLHAVGLAWGLAIVGLTLLVRVALLPIALRQADVQRRRAAHAPQMNAIRRRHCEDVGALRDELASYRKQHGLRGRGALAGVVLQVLVVLSLALLLSDDAAAGTFRDARWLFITDLSEPATGPELALLVGGWVAVQLVSLVLAARMGPRRIAIALLAPLPLLLAATQIPAGVLLYLLVSGSFGLAQKLALRARAPAPAPALVAT